MFNVILRFQNLWSVVLTK